MRLILIKEQLLLPRKMNNSDMCLICLSLTDKVRQKARYDGRTAELPSVEVAKLWINVCNFLNPIM
jgi:hypothetical protein